MSIEEDQSEKTLSTREIEDALDLKAIEEAKAEGVYFSQDEVEKELEVERLSE